MPATLDRTQQILGYLEGVGIRTVTLLIVPDSGWNVRELDILRELIGIGAELAGHGWRHQVDRIRGLKHRLHSALISRDVAEHLALDRAGAIALMQRCHAWFGEHDLPSPRLYVPPAWAMGNVPTAELDRLPYAGYEYVGGVYYPELQQHVGIPMVGYEADTAFRALVCRAWNAANRASAGYRRPLRIAIHPRDFELRLAADLRKLLDQGGYALSYDALLPV